MSHIEVREGQVWADNDRREDGRTVKVLRLESGMTHALVICLTDSEATKLAKRKSRVGYTSRIRLDRFKPTSTGYRLLAEPEGQEA